MLNVQLTSEMGRVSLGAEAEAVVLWLLGTSCC